MNRRRFLSAGTILAGSLALDRGPHRTSETASTDVPRLDAHTHVASPELRSRLERAVGRSPFPSLSSDALVARLDRDGIERAWLLSEGYVVAADVWQVTHPGEERAAVQYENDFIVREAARFPDRLVPFVSLNPKREYAVDEIDRCVEQHGVRGLKLHCWNSLVDVRDAVHAARLRGVLERAARHGLAVVVHAFNGAVRGFGDRDVAIWARQLVSPIADLRICFAHLGGAGGFAAPVQAVLAALVEYLGPRTAAADRVRVDLSAVLMGDNELGLPPTPPADRERMGELLRAWGDDRVLWGSDGIPGYLALSRDAWPLDAAAWRRVCRQRGVDVWPRRRDEEAVAPTADEGAGS